ncbi:M23 family metallopeptidase [Clostridium sp. CX1]|uniref:M23 family metallopeptidase n=1 Tax=Clostridium sp. CX1 TaxID=2978346 RepID=UPI0021C0EDDC|nr:M23 family metallopeptidase [Clostridium sp. CX1]MCT8978250.1 M23 family metallopeptidase [Clostridium sp. CX1]
MGHYNSEYEDYYSSLKRKSGARYSPYYNNGTAFSRRVKEKGNFWVRRLTTDLIGVLILFIIIMGCKLVVTPQTQGIYNYSKSVLNQNYDYKLLKEKSETINLSNVQEKILNGIGELRSKITGKETITDKIKKNFILPIEGTETSVFGYRTDPVTKEEKFHEGVDIDAKENTAVRASFNGKVKACGEDEQLGKYIIIDHGDGIETKYAHLNDILVKKEDAVKKSQVIAKSGNTGKSTGPHLHFELLYMGENKNPKEYFNIIKK